MRTAAFLSMGFLLLLVQSNLYRVLGILDPAEANSSIDMALGLLATTPNLTLPLIIFLGVQEPSTARGAAITFVLGYLTDIFASAPIGLFTFVAVALWWLARVLGVRLMTQTPLSRIPIVLGFAVAESAMVLTLLAIFGADTTRPREISVVVLPRAVMTALFSPIVFRIAHRLHQSTAPIRTAEGGAR